MNLVVNARDSMPSGGKITIQSSSVTVRHNVGEHRSIQPGRYSVVAVADTGHGMDKETQSRIFEPFFTTKEKGKGTGLGLSTVYGIVKQSNGYVSADSHTGTGTTFFATCRASRIRLRTFPSQRRKMKREDRRQNSPRRRRRVSARTSSRHTGFPWLQRSRSRQWRIRTPSRRRNQGPDRHPRHRRSHARHWWSRASQKNSSRSSGHQRPLSLGLYRRCHCHPGSAYSRIRSPAEALPRCRIWLRKSAKYYERGRIPNPPPLPARDPDFKVSKLQGFTISRRCVRSLSCKSNGVLEPSRLNHRNFETWHLMRRNSRQHCPQQRNKLTHHSPAHFQNLFMNERLVQYPRRHVRNT